MVACQIDRDWFDGWKSSIIPADIKVGNKWTRCFACVWRDWRSFHHRQYVQPSVRSLSDDILTVIPYIRTLSSSWLMHLSLVIVPWILRSISTHPAQTDTPVNFRGVHLLIHLLVNNSICSACPTKATQTQSQARPPTIYYYLMLCIFFKERTVVVTWARQPVSLHRMLAAVVAHDE